MNDEKEEAITNAYLHLFYHIVQEPKQCSFCYENAADR